MAELILKMSMTLDGYVASSDGKTEWATVGRSEDGAAWTLETVRNTSAHLIGATTYTQWSTFWPAAPGPFAEAMNDIPKIVFSNSLTSATWSPTTITGGDLTETVTRLKQEQPDGYLLAQGGVRFARSLVDTGLIDEYRMVVHPVVLGKGQRLFTTPIPIEAQSATVFSGGAVAHVFAAR